MSTYDPKYLTAEAFHLRKAAGPPLKVPMYELPKPAPLRKPDYATYSTGKAAPKTKLPLGYVVPIMTPHHSAINLAFVG